MNKGTSSLEDYLHKAKSLALSLCGTGKPMDNDEFIICILRGLESEFDPIVAALNVRDTFSSLEGVIGKLYDFEIRLQGARATTSNVAFYTNHGQTNPKPWVNLDTHCHNDRNFTRSASSSQAKETRFSRFNRGSSGTHQKQLSNHGGHGRGGITCFRCGGPKHKADGCFASNEQTDRYKTFDAIKIGETAEKTWYFDTGAN